MTRLSVYQDEDPLGRGEWFGYVTGGHGHISRNFGPFPTEEAARKHGRSLVGGAADHRGAPVCPE